MKHRLRITHRFEYAHALTGHKGKCERIHGHQGTVILEISKKYLNANGMVIDFSRIKKDIFKYIDNLYDHKTLIYEQDDRAEKLDKIDPASFYLLPFNPTAESMAWNIYTIAVELLPNSCNLVSVEFFETDTSSAIYRPND